MGDVKKERGQLAFLDAFVNRRPLNRHEHGDTGRRDANISLIIQTEVFDPLAAFRVRPLPAVSARAGGRLADNLAHIFRHLDEWKLNESHISYIVSHKIQLSTINLSGLPSQRLTGLLREFLTSRSLRREHWQGGTKRRVFLFEPVS